MFPLAVLSVALAPAAEPDRLPRGATARLGQVVLTRPNGMVVLPGEKEIAWSVQSSLYCASLDDPTPKLVWEGPTTGTPSRLSDGRNHLFLASDARSLGFTSGSSYMERFAIPLADKPLPESVKTEVRPGAGSLPIRFPRQADGTLVGYATDLKTSTLYRYDRANFRWVAANSTPLKNIVHRFEVGGKHAIASGKTSVTGSNLTLSVHDLDADRDLEPLRIEQVRDWALAADGSTLAVLCMPTGEAAVVRMIDMAKRTERLLKTHPKPVPVAPRLPDAANRPEHGTPPDQVFLSKDGGELAIAYRSFRGLAGNSSHVDFYDPATLTLRSRADVPLDTIHFGQFIAGGKQFVALGELGVIRRWETATGKPLGPTSPQGAVLRVAPQANGGWATLTADGSYRVWTGGKPGPAATMLPQSAAGQVFAASRDGAALYAPAADDPRRVVAWDLAAGKPRPGFDLRLDEGFRVSRLVVSPDGKALAIKPVIGGMTNHFLVADAATGKVVRTWASPVDERPKVEGLHSHMELTNDGRLLTSGHYGVAAFDTATPETRFINADGKGGRLHLSVATSDGKFLLAEIARDPTAPLLEGGLRDRDIGVFDAATGKPTRRIELLPTGRLPSNVTALALSPDDRWLGVGFESGEAQVFDLKEEKPAARSFAGHKQAVRCFGFAPDGKTFATGSDDNTALVWALDGK